MSLAASDLLHDADVFRRAYPSWPSAEPSAPCWPCRTGHPQDCRCGVLAATEAEYRRGREAGHAARLAGAWEDPGNGTFGHGSDRGWWDADDEMVRDERMAEADS